MSDYNTLHIIGGRPLRGEVDVHTAKNSALYLVAASLLTSEPVVLEDVARLSDIEAMLELLRYFGADVYWEGRDLHIHAQTIDHCDAPYHLVSKMRASFVMLGALLGRCGSAEMSMPGGCAFGPRPVDRHIKAFRDLGVTIHEAMGDFSARREVALSGRAVFEAPTVGGTQNVILASALGEDTVVIENAALEPEIADLANMLNAMGADIRGAGTRTITIYGAEALRGITFRPVPDRIEAGTFMLAAAATRGRVTLRHVNIEHLRALSDKLRDSGVVVDEDDATTLTIDATGPLRPIDVVAREYPGVPTDVQAPLGAYLATVRGESTVRDNVYNDRFTHVEELLKTGANLALEDDVLTIQGGPLRGARMHAADIRAGGALVIAALAAQGRSVVSGVKYIERGYEAFAERLAALGARIEQTNVIDLATGTYGD